MHPVPPPQDLAALLEEQLPFIDRMAVKLSRKHDAAADDTDDFASWAKLRLVESDYAILRKFRGESAVTTYLTVVMTMLYRDWRVARLGRWRPSAAARRLGDLAVQLERMVHRDGMSFAQAVRTLRSRGATDLSDAELARLWASLPPRTRARPRDAGDAPLERTPAPERADGELLRSEADARRAAMVDALARGMAALDPEDQTILRMRFWDGRTVADISRTLRLEQKPLYRRLTRLLATLRAALERDGVSADEIRWMTMDEEAE